MHKRNPLCFIHSFSPCPGMDPTLLVPTDDQKTTLIVIGAYTGAILVLWNMPIAKIILAPFKVLL